MPGHYGGGHHSSSFSGNHVAIFMSNFENFVLQALFFKKGLVKINLIYTRKTE